MPLEAWFLAWNGGQENIVNNKTHMSIAHLPQGGSQTGEGELGSHIQEHTALLLASKSSSQGACPLQQGILGPASGK